MKKKKSIFRKKTLLSKVHKKERQPQKPNKKVILYSLIAFIFIALSFTVNWFFIIGAAFMLWLNQKELIKKN